MNVVIVQHKINNRTSWRINEKSSKLIIDYHNFERKEMSYIYRGNLLPEANLVLSGAI